jgi:hypothetical protein
MDKKILFLGVITLVLALGLTVNAIPIQRCDKGCEDKCDDNNCNCCWKGSVNAGYLDQNEKFKVKNIFERTENVYAKYKSEKYCGDGMLALLGDKKVDVYFVKNAKWKAGDSIADSDILHSESVKLKDICSKNGVLVWKANTQAGKYDMFVDVSNCEIIQAWNPNADCSKIKKVYNPCMGDAVDSKRKIVGLEILPEVATSILLGLGLLSMVGYVTIKR